MTMLLRLLRPAVRTSDAPLRLLPRDRLSDGSCGVLACCVELGGRTASLTMPPRRYREQQQDDDLPPPPPPPVQMTPFERANVEMLAGITRLLERQTERPGKSHEEDVAERFRKQGPKDFVTFTTLLNLRGPILRKLKA
ncbi:hypothetical protein F511_37440 [Dorcoceras hygrometricum]|uniref:Uncharacterized protein n=1 Tax=Dorcoceras hygrometricum TaxID=472368 RepID=A0A2Z7AGW6_9LAMI|nr:hypothetical protein F511_37440 [Dorcoceras hygrometricum]